MIDLFQWRASIGLWNCCQAASGRPAKASKYSFKSSKSNKGKIQRLSKNLLLCVLIIFFIVFLIIHLKHNTILSKGIAIFFSVYLIFICILIGVHEVQQSTAVYFEIYTDSNQNVCYHHLVFLLLLLAGDIELNPGPGPMTGKKCA